MNIMIWVWLAAIVVFAVAEAATAGLTSIWFAGGAVGGFIAALLKGSLVVQMVVFIAVSALLLACTRPFVKKAMGKGGKVATNADRVLGELAKVTETVDNVAGTGAVYVEGKTWTARTAGEETIPAGALVKILRMEGVKLFVEKCEITEEVK